MEKRGVVEVDWIVSIGIFLVFLALFFAYLAPYNLKQPDASEALLGNVEDKIKLNATWNIARFPMFIDSYTSSTEPVITDFLYAWENISFSDNTSFFRQENKLLFQANLRIGSNLRWVVTSNEPYPQPAITADLAPTPNSLLIDGSRFQAEFDGLPTAARHFDKSRIANFNISLDGTALQPESASKVHNFTSFAAKYKIEMPQLNHTTFVMAGFPRLYSFITTDKLEKHNVTIAMTLHNYTRYFINNQQTGSLNSTMCASAFTDYIDFYDAVSGLSFVTNEKAEMSFCAGNTTVSFSLALPLEKETSYTMLFHEDDYTETLNFTTLYTVRAGMVENISGLSMELLAQLSNSSYSNLKDAWGYPEKRELSFQVLNESNQPLINYSPKSPGIVNAFAREFDAVVLDKYGIKTKRTIRLRGW